eukprot:Rmarinus@m.28172
MDLEEETNYIVYRSSEGEAGTRIAFVEYSMCSVETSECGGSTMAYVTVKPNVAPTAGLATCVYLQGTTAFIMLPSSVAPGPEFTVELWFLPTSIHEGMTILALNYITTDYLKLRMLRGNIVVFLGTEFCLVSYDSSQMDSGLATHLAVIGSLNEDEGMQVVLGINGEELGACYFDTVIEVDEDTIDGTYWTIGHGLSRNDDYVVGYVDHLRIWSYPRTIDEIRVNMMLLVPDFPEDSPPTMATFDDAFQHNSSSHPFFAATASASASLDTSDVAYFAETGVASPFFVEGSQYDVAVLAGVEEEICLPYTDVDSVAVSGEIMSLPTVGTLRGSGCTDILSVNDVLSGTDGLVCLCYEPGNSFSEDYFSYRVSDYLSPSWNTATVRVVTFPRGPSIVSITAVDPQGTQDGFGIGDELRIAFDTATNQPEVGSFAQIRRYLSFSQDLTGIETVGAWAYGGTMLVIVVTEMEGDVPTPEIGEFTVSVFDGIYAAGYRSQTSQSVSPKLSGSWTAVTTAALYTASGLGMNEAYTGDTTDIVIHRVDRDLYVGEDSALVPENFEITIEHKNTRLDGDAGVVENVPYYNLTAWYRLYRAGEGTLDIRIGGESISGFPREVNVWHNLSMTYYAVAFSLFFLVAGGLGGRLRRMWPELKANKIADHDMIDRMRNSKRSFYLTRENVFTWLRVFTELITFLSLVFVHRPLRGWQGSGFAYNLSSTLPALVSTEHLTLLGFHAKLYLCFSLVYYWAVMIIFIKSPYFRKVPKPGRRLLSMAILLVRFVGSACFIPANNYMFSVVACEYPDGQPPFLRSQHEIECWTGEHIMLLLMTLVGILVYSVPAATAMPWWQKMQHSQGQLNILYTEYYLIFSAYVKLLMIAVMSLFSMSNTGNLAILSLTLIALMSALSTRQPCTSGSQLRWLVAFYGCALSAGLGGIMAIYLGDDAGDYFILGTCTAILLVVSFIQYKHDSKRRRMSLIHAVDRVINLTQTGAITPTKSAKIADIVGLMKTPPVGAREMEAPSDNAKGGAEDVNGGGDSLPTAEGGGGDRQVRKPAELSGSGDSPSSLGRPLSFFSKWRSASGSSSRELVPTAATTGHAPGDADPETPPPVVERKSSVTHETPVVVVHVTPAVGGGPDAELKGGAPGNRTPELLTSLKGAAGATSDGGTTGSNAGRTGADRDLLASGKGLAETAAVWASPRSDSRTSCRGSSAAASPIPQEPQTLTQTQAGQATSSSSCAQGFQDAVDGQRQTPSSGSQSSGSPVASKKRINVVHPL